MQAPILGLVNDPEHAPDRTQEILAAVLKVVAVAVAIGLAIGVVTWVVVKKLDLGTVDNSSIGIEPLKPITPLPLTALPSPTQTPTQTPTATDTTTAPVYIAAGPTNPTPTPGSTALFLSASPVVVHVMDRINLTGEWPGHDSISLLVQQFDGGKWVDFGVQTQVEIGTFATYVQSGHSGSNRFRVYDPSSNTASNAVTVQVN